ncbi:hypothetical protein [Desertivirga arenae]|uniref:hypothetical protein n=1 Tax=Desertivirga arenae TaxID=2810309 RepID=UPI001A959FFB|nr:hypothetical protein [Pedobacter sp. SYSU D00823]
MNKLELAGFRPVREENTLIGSVMKPFELVKDLKASGLIFLTLLLLLILGWLSSTCSSPVKYDFLFFPVVQKAVGIRIPATDLLDSTDHR